MKSFKDIFSFLLIICIFVYQVHPSELAKLAKNDNEKEEAKNIKNLLDQIEEQKLHPVVIREKTELPEVLIKLIVQYNYEDIINMAKEMSVPYEVKSLSSMEKYTCFQKYRSLPIDIKIIGTTTPDRVKGLPVDWSADFILCRIGLLLDAGSRLTLNLLEKAKEDKALFAVILKAIEKRNKCVNLEVADYDQRCRATDINRHLSEYRGFTPLIYAAQNENVQLGLALIKAGANLEVQILVKNHDDIEIKTVNALINATAFHCYELVQALIDAGANPNTYCDGLGHNGFVGQNTPVTSAVFHAHMTGDLQLLNIILSSKIIDLNEPHLKKRVQDLQEYKNDKKLAKKTEDILAILKKAGMKE